jgi:predicted dehydrogenase
MSQSLETIRIGVIGCGHWGPNHVRVFSHLTGSRVVACADPDARRREAVVAQFPNVCAFADHRDLLRQSDIHAVVVAVPTRLHLQMVEESLNAGKHVLCEKPLCLTAAESQRLVELAAAKGRVLMVGHVFLFNAGIVRLRQYIREGTPGRVLYLRATRTNLGPIRSDVNAVYDLATHDISIFNYLLDAMPESVSAVGGCFLQPGIDDVAFISLRYPGNRLGHIQVSWLDPKKLREIVVVGDKRMLVWDDLAAPGPIQIYDKGVDRPPDYEDFGQFHLLTREGDLTIPKVKLEEPLRTQDRFFLEAVRSGRLEFNDGAFAVGVQKVLEAISASLEKGGGVVPVAA